MVRVEGRRTTVESDAGDDMRNMPTMGTRQSRDSAVSMRSENEEGLLKSLGEQDFEKAIEHMKQIMPGRGEKGLAKLHVDEFGQWGVGIQLYFQFTAALMKLSVVIALLYLPQYIMNQSGDSIRILDKSRIDLSQEFLAKGMIPNLGRLSTDDAEGVVNYTATYERKVEIVPGNIQDIRDVTFGLSVLDALASMLILCLIWWFDYIHIPKVVRAHKNEFVTPEIYTVFVDCLPKRNFGPGGQDAYADKLKNHFELILAAQVTTKSARKGLVVVRADDEGAPDHHRRRWFGLPFCPVRQDGYGPHGRRTGRICKMGTNYCYVMWDRSEDEPDPVPTKCRLSDGDKHGELRDANVLWRLEAAGLQPYQPDPKDAKENCSVYSVSLMRDFEENLAEMKVMSKQDDRTLEVKLRQLKQKRQHRLQKARSGESWALPKSISRHSIGKALHKAGSGLGRKTRRRSESAHELHDLELALDQNINLEERCVVGAFVVFNHIPQRDFIMAEYRFSRTPARTFLHSKQYSFNGYKLRVSDAQSPCDVFWDNLDFPISFRIKRRLQVLSCMLLLLAAVVFPIAIAKGKADQIKKQNAVTCTGNDATDHVYCQCNAAGMTGVLQDIPTGIAEKCGDWMAGKVESGLWAFMSSTIVIAGNFFGGYVVTILAKLEKPRTISDMNSTIMIMTSIVYVLVLGPIRTFINMKAERSVLFKTFGAGDYRDLSPDWYLNVGSSIVMTLLFNTFYPLVNFFQAPLFFLGIRMKRHKQKLWTDLVDLYTPPEFFFALRHAEQVAQTFAILTYCGGMPILALFLPVVMLLYNWVDKYTFLRGSRTPPRYTESCMVRHVQLLQFSVLIHTFFSVYAYANQDSAPSYKLFTTTKKLWGFNIGNTELGRGNNYAESLVSKMLVRSALPCSVVGCLVILSYFGAFVGIIVRSNTWKAVFSHLKADELDMEDSFHSEIAAMKRRGIETSYEIHEVPGYDFLKGCEHGIQKVDDILEGIADRNSVPSDWTGTQCKKLALESKGGAGVVRSPSAASSPLRRPLAERAKAKPKAEGDAKKVRVANGGKGKGRNKTEVRTEARTMKAGNRKKAQSADGVKKDQKVLVDEHFNDIELAKERLGINNLRAAAKVIASSKMHSGDSNNAPSPSSLGSSKGKGKGKAKGLSPKSASAPAYAIGDRRARFPSELELDSD